MKNTDYGQRFGRRFPGCAGMEPCMGGADGTPLYDAGRGGGPGPVVEGPVGSGCGCGISHQAAAGTTPGSCGCGAASGRRRPASYGGNGYGRGTGEPVRGGFRGCAVPAAQTGGRAAGHDRTGIVCGGSHHGQLDEIRAVEFALCELVLYLDAYPDCCEALGLYHELLEKREELVKKYEHEVGPLTNLGNESCSRWDWVSKPFPWEFEAND